MSDDTTAETLGKFYKGLIESGVPEVFAGPITMDFAHALVRGEADV